MRNNRKKILRNQSRKYESSILKKELLEFSHRNKEIEQAVRSIAKVDFDMETLSKRYERSVAHDFVAIIHAELYISMLKDLRKEAKLQASEVDLRLGYTVGYPIASLSGTAKKPTKNNIKTSFEIFKRMLLIFPNEMKEVVSPKSEYSKRLFDTNDIINRALMLNGIYDEIKSEDLIYSGGNNMNFNETNKQGISEIESTEIQELSVITFSNNGKKMQFENLDDKTLKIIKRLNDTFELNIKAVKEVISEEELF